MKVVCPAKNSANACLSYVNNMADAVSVILFKATANAFHSYVKVLLYTNAVSVE